MSVFQACREISNDHEAAFAGLLLRKVFALRVQAFVQSVRQWESPAVSIAAMAIIVLGCFHPHLLTTLAMLALVLYGLHRHTPDAGAHLRSSFLLMLQCPHGHRLMPRAFAFVILVYTIVVHAGASS